MTMRNNITPSRRFGRSGLVGGLLALTTALTSVQVAPRTATASENYDLTVETQDYASSCEDAAMAHEGDAFFQVNGYPIPTYTVAGKYVKWPDGSSQDEYLAEFSSVLFKPGSNSIFFAIQSTGSDQTCVRSTSQVTLSSATFAPRQIFDVLRNGTIFQGTTNINFSLWDLDPALAQSITNLENSLKSWRANLVADAGKVATRDADIAAKLDLINKLDADLKTLAGLGWEDITPDALTAIFAKYPTLPTDGQAALVQLVKDLQKGVADLQTELSRLVSDFGAQAEQVEDAVTADARASGFVPGNIQNYATQIGSLELPPVALPDFGAQSTFDDTDDPYARYADKIISDLSAAVTSGKVTKKPEFAATVRGWRANQAAMERIINARATVNAFETKAYLQAQTRVLGVIRTYMDATDWFKDAPVSPELRTLLDGPIKARFADYAKAIKDGMNLWTVKGTKEQMLEDSVLSVGYVLANEFNTLSDDAKGMVSQVLGWASTAVTTAVGFTPVGDVLDACQAITGRENCNPNGNMLSTTDRVASALGVVIGSSKFWAAVGTVVTAKVVATKVSVFLASMPAIPIPTRVLLRTRLGKQTLAHLSDITGPDILDIMNKLSDAVIVKFAKSVGGAGLLQLRKLQGIAKFSDPAIIKLVNDPNVGKSVRALGPLQGTTLANLRSELKRVGMTRAADVNGQEIWVNLADSSLVRIAPKGTAFRPTPHFKKEVMKVKGVVAQVEEGSAFKLTDELGSPVAAGSKQASEHFNQWFTQTLEKKYKADVGTNYRRAPTADELADMMKVWGDATHISYVP